LSGAEKVIGRCAKWADPDGMVAESNPCRKDGFNISRSGNKRLGSKHRREECGTYSKRDSSRYQLQNAEWHTRAHATQTPRHVCRANPSHWPYGARSRGLSCCRGNDHAGTRVSSRIRICEPASFPIDRGNVYHREDWNQTQKHQGESVVSVEIDKQIPSDDERHANDLGNDLSQLRSFQRILRVLPNSRLTAMRQPLTASRYEAISTRALAW
jgi:hypothetical protein